MGDVLAVVASLFGICFSTWALLMASALLFPSRAELAGDAIRRSPWRMLGRGTLLTSLFGVIGLGMLASPLPAAKLVGWVFVLSLFALSTLGMAGLATIASDRIQRMEPALSQYACFVRAAGILVVPSVVPFLGWFLIAPALLLIGVGAGWAAALGRERQTASESTLV